MRVGLVLLAVIVGSCGQSPEEKAKALASYDLFDPGSAQFRNIEQVGKGCVSGEINAKNKMGAYSGFRPFLVDVETKHVAIAAGVEESDAAISSARMGMLMDQCGVENQP